MVRKKTVKEVDITNQRKDKYANSLSLRSKRRIEALKKHRKRRAVATAEAALAGSMLGYVAAAQALRKNSEFEKLLPVINACAATAAGGVGGGVYLRHSEEVKKATNLLGVALAKETKKNSQLRDFLLQYRYVIIDGKGNIKGTNSERFLKIGRIRLESKKILAGEYKKERKTPSS